MEPDLLGAAEAFRRRIEYYRTDPAVYIRQVHGYSIWEKQQDICAAAARESARVCVASAHGLGKSFTLSLLVWWFIHTMPRTKIDPETGRKVPSSTKVIITAPSRTSATAILASNILARWQELHQRFPDPMQHQILGLGDRPTQYGWTAPWHPETKIFWFATREDDAGKSGHATKAAGHHADHLLFVFEEASGIKKVIWDSIKGSLMGADRRLVAIGNPVDPTSPFARFYRTEGVTAIRINAEEFPRVTQGDNALPYGPTKASIKEVEREYGRSSSMYQWKVLGLFPTAGGEDVLIGFDTVDQALEREPIDCVHSPAMLSIGCDTSRFGSDRTVLIVTCRKCNAIIDAEHRTKDGLGSAPEMAIAGMILAAARRWKMKPIHARRIQVDNTGGYGGGAVDFLREQEGWPIVGVSFATAAKDEDDQTKFVNRRAELWWRLRKWLTEDACLGDLDGGAADLLREELTAPKYKYTGKDQIQLESKDNIKARVGRSPDYGDALALAVDALPPLISGSRRLSEQEFKRSRDPYYERDNESAAPESGYQVAGVPGPRGKHLSDW